MRGIDISSWQAGINLPACMDDFDFCIVKATGGTAYINPYCDIWVQQCIEAGKPWGFYHFGNDNGYNSAADEAKYFIDNCWNYFGHGIPILDWEIDDIDAYWVNTFVNIVHSETGIWCWVYGNPWRFDYNVEQNCGRWIASYPDIDNPSLYDKLPDCPEANGLVCAWQFASDCHIPHYHGNLDASVFFGDEEAWAKYAGYWVDIKPEPEPQPEPIPEPEPEPEPDTDNDIPSLLKIIINLLQSILGLFKKE